MDRVRQRLSRMAPFEKMVEYTKAMIRYGDYSCIPPPRSSTPLFMLDNVSYARSFADDPLPIPDLLAVFDVDPSYGTITGDAEIGAVVLALEEARACVWAAHVGLPPPRVPTEALVVFSTSGATGAASTVLGAALARNRDACASRRTEIVYNVPCYCLPDAFARLHGLAARPVVGPSTLGFLPPLDDMRAAVTDATLACFLTYPTNPSLRGLRGEDAPAMRRLIEHCQSLGVLLVADTVFQDLCWGGEPVPEIFALASSPAWLAKIQSPSKDRVRACGYRVGYLVADRGLEPWLSRVEALAKNSTNTLSHAWLALDSLFRTTRLGGGLSREGFELLEGKFIFGYDARPLDAATMLERVLSAGLFERYERRIASFEAAIRRDLLAIHGALAASACFEPAPLPQFGNLLMARVRAPFDHHGDEDRFFLDLLTGINVATSVGGCFGLPVEHGVWIRVAVGGAPASEIIAALARVEEHLAAAPA